MRLLVGRSCSALLQRSRPGCRAGRRTRAARPASRSRCSTHWGTSFLGANRRGRCCTNAPPCSPTVVPLRPPIPTQPKEFARPSTAPPRSRHFWPPTSTPPYAPPDANSSMSSRVAREDVVAIFRGRVARKARLQYRLAVGLPVSELSEPPAAGRGEFLGILHHDLNVCRGPGDKRFRQHLFGRLRAKLLFQHGADCQAVLLGRGLLPCKPSDDCAVRGREGAGSKCLYGNVVTQLGAHVVDRRTDTSHGDQRPVAVVRRECDPVDGICLLISLSGCRRHEGDSTHEQRQRNETNSFHTVTPSKLADTSLRTSADLSRVAGRQAAVGTAATCRSSPFGSAKKAGPAP